MPALVGAAAAWGLAREFNGPDFALTLAGLVSAHLGINLFNDYHDFLQGADGANPNRNPFSGGGPALIERRIAPPKLWVMAATSLAAAAACGVVLMIRVDGGIGPVFWLMLVGGATGYFYTAPPVKLVYRGWGEAFIFLDFGVLPVLGAYYVLTGGFSWGAALASIPVAALVTNILWINQFPDAASDAAAGKETLVVRLGVSASRWVYGGLLVVAAGAIIVAPVVTRVPGAVRIALPGLAPGAAALGILIRRYADPPRLIKAQALTIMAQLATGLLLSIGFLV